ncbi:MAG: GntP family permease [Limisphaerales bacterium]
MSVLFSAAEVTGSRWPFVVLLASVTFVIVAITKLRLHAFIALIFAAFLAGFLAEPFKPAVLGKLSAGARAAAEGNHWLATVELTMVEFGSTAAAISISIGLAAIIGMALMESGAADKVVRRFLAFFGEKRAGAALLWSTYFLSIPIFFDTMFMLMVPLARALRLRTGKDYTLYLLCICCGGVVTHSLTVPHPGPLAVVDNLKLNVGLSLIWGIIGGILPCAGGYWVAKWLNRRVTVPLRETRGAALSELEGISKKSDAELPSFFWSILPVILPIILISLGSTFVVIKGSFPGVVAAMGGDEAFGAVNRWVAFFGNKNIALFIGAGLALWVLARQRGFSFRQIENLIGPPIETAGVIILITSAGGAFGLMLRNAGVGDAIKDAAMGYQVNVVLLSWVVATVIRVAQGSATVAMLTTSAMVFPMVDPAAGAALPCHPMYVYLAIGFGAFTCSWMNDSGFWVVNRLSGMTETETLKTWTVMLTAVSVIGLAMTLLLSWLVPLV